MPIDVTLSRKPDDPLCLRASIGGKEELGYYCTIRGNQAAIIKMLRSVLYALERAPKLSIENEQAGPDAN